MARKSKSPESLRAAERDAFIKFPWRIYQNDPAWVPPLLLERKEFLDREKHPFFEHGKAEFFLARRDGEIVGRIMASDDPKYNALHGSNVGCFGMFESIDDQEVANALFEAAADGCASSVATRSWGRSIIRRIISAGCSSTGFSIRRCC